jgi:biofilm PGA synthesis N-glycosyltransferase PgaC
MPETLKGLWRQRLRWAIGGTQAVIAATHFVFFGGGWRMMPIWINYVVSIGWAFAVIVGTAFTIIVGTLQLLRLTDFPIGGPFAEWPGVFVAFTYFLQAIVALSLDARFERGMLKSIFWIVWYPLVFWLLQALSTFVALFKALARGKKQAGTWISPDRGIR